VAVAIGKIDALLFALGIFAGSFLFEEAVPYFSGFYHSGSRGALTLSQWLNWNTGIVVFLIVAVALGAFWVSEKCERPWRLYQRLYGKHPHGEEQQ
jgi:hypothetical protein